jgi:hypothetical protein
MFKKSYVVAAIAAAALATAAPASAMPTDAVTLDTGFEFQFGDYNSCSPGAAPAAPAVVDWNESANGQSVRPQIKGSLCLQDTTAEARVAVIYHDDAPQTISKFSSTPGVGNGSPLSTFYVDETGPRVSKNVLDHLHLRIEEPDGAGGWDAVSGAEVVLNVP